MSSNDSLTIGGLNNSLYTDPYLMKALSSPNYYQLAAMQNAGANVGNKTSAASTTGVGNPTFGSSSGIIQQPQEESDSGSGWLAGGITAAAAIAGTACWLASRGKSAGAKGIWNQIKTGFNSFGKKAATETNRISVRTVNGEQILSLPNNTRALNAHTVTNLEGEANRLGLNVNSALKWTDDAAQLKSTHLEFDLGGTNYKGIYRNGEIVSLEDAAKNKLDLNNLTDNNLKTKLDEIKTALASKKAPTDVNLSNTCYVQNLGDNNTAVFLSDAKNNGLRVIRTNRYGINDEGVVAACADSEFAAARQGLIDGKYDSWKVTSGVWSPKDSKTIWQRLGFQNASEYKGSITGNKWDNNLSFVIKDGKIAGLSRDGGATIAIRQGTPKFEDLKVDYQSLFENALTHQAEFKGDIVRIMA